MPAPAKKYPEPQAFEDGAPPLNIEMQPVKSTQLAAIGYDAETKTLAIRFAHGIGSMYHYPDVEPETFTAMLGAASIGSFFGAHIKALPFRKYRPEPANASA